MSEIEYIKVDKQFLLELRDTLTDLKRSALEYESVFEMRIPTDLRVKIEDCVILNDTLNELL